MKLWGTAHMTELLFYARGYLSRVAVLVVLQLVIAGLMVISNEKNNPIPVMTVVFLGFVSLWIWLSIVVKRVDARGKSSAWAIIAFIPIIGLIWAAVDFGFASRLW